MKEKIKQFLRNEINSLQTEYRKVSYIRLIVISLYLSIAFLLTILSAFGRMLIEGVLIINPFNNHLSSSSINTIEQSIISKKQLKNINWT